MKQMIRLYARNYIDHAEFGFGTNLLKSKGIGGKASRFGYKKAKQGMRLGKSLGRSAVNRVNNSRTFQKGLAFGKKQIKRLGQ